MELISRDETKRIIDETLCSIDYVPFWVFDKFSDSIESIPTIEVQKEGRWIPVDSYSVYGGCSWIWEAHGNPIAYHYCSECKNQANVNEFGEELLTNYCPNCGARMQS